MRIRALYLLLIAAVVYSCQRFTQGQRLYETHCATCHMDDGTGLAGLIPPLDSADFLQLNRADVPCMILHGVDTPIVVNGVEYSEIMLGVPTLNAVEISNIINYIHTSWGNDLPPTSPSEVEKYLERCAQ